MKKHYKTLISLVLCLILISTMALSAVADSGTLLDKLNAQEKEIETAEEKPFPPQTI